VRTSRAEQSAAQRQHQLIKAQDRTGHDTTGQDRTAPAQDSRAPAPAHDSTGQHKTAQHSTAQHSTSQAEHSTASTAAQCSAAQDIAVSCVLCRTSIGHARNVSSAVLCCAAAWHCLCSSVVQVAPALPAHFSGTQHSSWATPSELTTGATLRGSVSTTRSEHAIFARFCTKRDRFAKTGSGQA
jgi:hypothetical protein